MIYSKDINVPLLYCFRTLLILVLLSYLFSDVHVMIKASSYTPYTSIVLGFAILYTFVIDTISGLIMLSIIGAFFVRQRKEGIKEESFRGGLVAYGDIGEDSNKQYRQVDKIPLNYVQVEVNSETLDDMNVVNEIPYFSSEEMEIINPTVLNRIQTNIVGNTATMNAEVRTWINESGPQGMSYPNGYSLDSMSNQVDMLLLN